MMRLLSAMPLVVGLLVPALPSQDSLPGCFLPRAMRQPSIVVARIEEVESASDEKKMTTAVMSVGQYLKGEGEAGRKVEVVVDWTPGMPTPVRSAGQPAWRNIVPAVGKRLLLSITPWESIYRAECVADLTTNGPEIIKAEQRLLNLEKISPDKEADEFDKALDDPSATVRFYADAKLTPARRPPEMRQRIFEKFAPIALDAHNPRRQQAIDFIESDYDPHAPDSEANSRILSFMADLAADPDAQVRSAAVQYLHSKYFSDLKNKPNPSYLRPRNREKVVNQLQQDVNDQRPFAPQAQRLLGLLETSQ